MSERVVFVAAAPTPVGRVGRSPARQTTLDAGLPHKVSATTISKVRGRFDEEILPVEIRQRKRDPLVFAREVSSRLFA